MFVIKYKLENELQQTVKSEIGADLVFDTKEEAEAYLVNYTKGMTKKEASKINICEMGFNVEG